MEVFKPLFDELQKRGSCEECLIKLAWLINPEVAKILEHCRQQPQQRTNAKCESTVDHASMDSMTFSVVDPTVESDTDPFDEITCDSEAYHQRMDRAASKFAKTGLGGYKNISESLLSIAQSLKSKQEEEECNQRNVELRPRPSDLHMRPVQRTAPTPTPAKSGILKSTAKPSIPTNKTSTTPARPAIHLRKAAVPIQSPRAACNEPANQYQARVPREPSKIPVPRARPVATSTQQPTCRKNPIIPKPTMKSIRSMYPDIDQPRKATCGSKFRPCLVKLIETFDPELAECLCDFYD